MNKQKFVELLRTPEKMSESDLVELEALAKENPYFQSGHIVLARGSRLLKNPTSGKKINTAAIYATNRTILKHYMQGQMSLVKSPSSVKKQKPTPAPSVAKQKPVESPKAAAPIKAEEKKAPSTPRKAPQMLSKSDHDILIEDIYSNLEKWKKSRDQYLEFEKTSDEPQLSTKNEDLGDAVEKIKNQIAEEVIAEDKVVSDQLEKIEASQTTKEPSEPAVDEISREEDKTTELKESIPEDEEKEDSITSSVSTSEEVSGTAEEKKESPDPADEEQVSDEAKEDKPTLKKMSGEDFLKIKKMSLLDRKAIGEDKPVAEDKLEEAAPKKEIQEEIVSDVAHTSEEEIDLSDDKVTSKLIDEEVFKNTPDVSEKEEEVEKPTPGKEEIDVSDDEITSKIIDEEVSKSEATVSEEVEEQVESDEKHEAVEEDEVVAAESTSTEEEIDLTDDKVTSKIIDEEISKKESDKKEKAEPVGDVDEKLDSLNKEKEALHLEPSASKPDKKFRLSILKKPTLKKGKSKLLAKKEEEKKEKKSDTKAAATEKSKTKTTATKKSTTKKTTPKPATKKATTNKKTEKAAKVEKTSKAEEPKEKKEEKKSAKKPLGTKKFKLGTSIASKASKKVASKKSTKPQQSEIIDSFLSENPTLKVDQKKLENDPVDLTAKVTGFPEETATENLTLILENQGKYDLAISVYEKLKTKYPEKESEFQAQIERISSISKGSEKGQEELLTKFIEENPTILVSNWIELIEVVEEFAKDVPALSDEQITESMAEVLLHQNDQDKAIAIYERLISIDPDKKEYFESQVKKLKKK